MANLKVSGGRPFRKPACTMASEWN